MRPILHLLLRADRPRFLLGLAMGLAGSGCFLLLIDRINRLLQPGAAVTLAEGAALLLLVLASAALSAASQHHLSRFGCEKSAEIRISVARSILGMSYEQCEKAGTRQLYALLTDELDAVSSAIGTLAPLVLSLSIAVGGFAYLAWTSPLLFACTAAILAAGLLVSRLLMRRLHAALHAGALAERQLHKHYEGLLHGGKEMRLDPAKLKFFLHREFGENVATLREHRTRSNFLLALGGAWNDVLLFLLIVSILALGAGVLGVPAHVLASYVITLLFVRGPITTVVDLAPVYLRGVLALEHLGRVGVRVLGAPDVAVPGPAGSRPQVAEIALEEVRYVHAGADRSFELGPVSLAARRGEVTFISGGNGAGKTTLMKVLCGLYTPHGGRVLVDGAPLAPGERPAVRVFSAVLSDSYVFDFLSANGEDPCAQDAVVALLAQMRLDSKVDYADGRLRHPGLSHGQQKRLGLVSVLMEDSPIVVFDEWAANQDAHFKAYFYDEVLARLKAAGKIVFVVTHDTAWLHKADRIVRLEDGRTAPAVARPPAVPSAAAA